MKWFLLFFLSATFFETSAFAKSPLLQVAAPRLHRYNVDRNQVTVSGLSSGAFMAVQLQVAYSEVFTGAGIFAGGIYGCSNGDPIRALNVCMANPQEINVDQYLALVKEKEKAGKISSLENLKKSKIFIYTGSKDTTLKPESSLKLNDFFKAFSQNIFLKNDIPGEHGFPVSKGGMACDFKGQPWLLNCNYDGAGELFRFLYGDVKNSVPEDAKNMILFDGSELLEESDTLSSDLFAYVPTSCLLHKKCKLHIALHGCRQNPEFVQDSFRTKAGYNEWAESNDVIVLYPSVKVSAENPKGCWDWFAYTGADFSDRNAKQMKSIIRMIDRIVGLEGALE